MQLTQKSGFEVLVNGEATRVPTGTTVAGLLEELGLAGRRVAVALNREIVRRGTYDDRVLADGDRVEVLEAVGGGS